MVRKIVAGLPWWKGRARASRPHVHPRSAPVNLRQVFPSILARLRRLGQGIGAIALALLLVLGGIVGGLSWGAWPAIADDYTKVILRGADFANQDLRDDEFTKADVRQSDFHGSNLRGVRFFAANLEEVNFEGADLSFTTLDSARLVNANLKNAVLEGAFASNTKFDGAVIEGADFTDVLLRPDAERALCQVAAGVNPTTGRATRETLFCP